MEKPEKYVDAVKICKKFGLSYKMIEQKYPAFHIAETLLKVQADSQKQGIEQECNRIIESLRDRAEINKDADDDSHYYFTDIADELEGK